MSVSAYEGNQPYIFISYAHKDSDTVLPIIESLTASGFRVWYDAGIEKGSHWNDNIANHLENCTIFIPLISKAFCESKYCQMELHHACVMDKDPLPIYLENVDLSAVSRGNNMWISQFQKIFYYEMLWEEFIKVLLANPLLDSCTGDKKVVIAKPPKSTPAEAPLLKRAHIFLEDGEFEQADAYFDKVLDSDPENGEAYLGKLMAKLKIKSESALKVIRHLDKDSLFQKALRYSSNERKEQLTLYANEGNAPYRIKNGTLCGVDKNITECVIPHGVTSIGDKAFFGCQRLTSITIPDSVTSIGEEAFNGCKSLKSVTIPDSVISINEGAFWDCSSLTSITIPDNVTSIGYGAFMSCSYLSSVTIGNSVTSIGGEAFLKCQSLTSITIPDSVTSIGNGAFFKCQSLTSITIPDSVTSIGKSAFQYCTRLKKVTLGNGVTNIGESAFKCCGLMNITIPNGVTSIGGSAFQGCQNLTSVTIPDSVTSIGMWAFADCSSLTSVTISDSVTRIGMFVFADCTRLEKVIGGKSLKHIDDSAFHNCPKLKKKPKAGGGCYVATCVYGSYDCPEVWTLRRYRDERLGASWFGRLFIRLYYAVSPTLVKWFGHTRWFKKLFKKRLDKMVQKLQNEGFEDTPYEDKTW